MLNNANDRKVTLRKEDVKAHFAGHWRDFYSRYLELQNGNGAEHKAVCPFHPDSDPSMSINNDTGLFRCFGCDAQGDVFQFYGQLKGISLFDGQVRGIAMDFNIPSSNGKKESGPGRIVATYDYKDVNSTLLYQAVRMEPKAFRQRRPDGKGGWIWNVKDVDKVLYRLPEILEADLVLLVEGEKDADNLFNLGFTATTNVGGAGKWQPSYSGSLRDKDIVILPDNDEPGRKHADQVAKALKGIAKSVKVIELPDLSEKGDVSDWLDSGGTKGALQKLINQAETWAPEDPEPDIKQLFPRGPFPWEVLPLSIAESLQQLARACATSPTSLPGAAISIFASTIGCRVNVSPKLSWNEPLIFWFCDVRPSGAGKTPPARALCRILYEAQDKADSDYKEKFEVWKALPKIDRDAEPEPARPRGYFTTDLTLEGLHADHSGHGGKVVILDEVSSFLSSQNQYKSKGSDREGWICLYDGKPARITRAKGSKTIKGARVSIFGGIQPGVWRSCFSGSDGKIYLVDGTIYRFLPTYEGNGFRPLTAEAWTDDSRAEWETMLCAAMQWADSQDENKTLRLNAEAQQIFFDWRNALYQTKEDLPEPVRGFIPKLIGVALRFAGVLYLMNVFSRGNEPGSILNVPDIQKGIRVSEFYLGHIISAMEALTGKEAIIPIEMTEQVILLAKTLKALEPEVDNGKLAIGYIQENFNQTCGKDLFVKSPHLMGSILRQCDLDITGGVHNANGKRGVKCLMWNQKIKLFMESCLNCLSSLQKQEYRGSTGSDIEKELSDLSALQGRNQGVVQTSQTLKKSCLHPETGIISGCADKSDKADNFPSVNKKTELDFSF